MKLNIMTKANVFFDEILMNHELMTSHACISWFGRKKWFVDLASSASRAKNPTSKFLMTNFV